MSEPVRHAWHNHGHISFQAMWEGKNYDTPKYGIARLGGEDGDGQLYAAVEFAGLWVRFDAAEDLRALAKVATEAADELEGLG